MRRSPKFAAAMLAITMIFGLATVSTAQVTPGNVTPLDVPVAGGWSITPTSINDHGVVTANVGCNCPPSAMLWDKTTGWTSIGGLGIWTYPEAINNNGLVVGMNLATDFSHNQGLLWDATNQWRAMQFGAGVGVFPRDLNDSGVVIGSSWQGPFAYSESAGVTLITGIEPYAINNAGQIVGHAGGNGYNGAIREVDGTVRLLAPGGDAIVEAINNAGQPAGRMHTPSGWQGAVWSPDGSVATIPALGGFEEFEYGWLEASWVTAINDHGQAVGLSTTQHGTLVPFVWDKVSGLRQIMVPGYTTVRPVDINNNGEVIATTNDNAQDRGLYFTVPPPVPPTPQAATDAVADDVEALVESGALTAANAGSITTKLDAAIAALDRGNVDAATNQLNAAINRVNALVNSGKLTAAQGQELRDALQAVVNSL